MSVGSPGHPPRELTSAMLTRLLERLGESPDEAGAKYNALRLRLVHYFRWQQLAQADDLADEVLSRVARRLHEGEDVPQLFGYVTGVARLVALEARQRGAREHRAWEEYTRRALAASEPDIETSTLACLERCLATLSSERRAHVLAYYTGDRSERIRQRSQLAQQLGVGPVALRNRMLRLRQHLEACLAQCLDAAGDRDRSTPSHTSDRQREKPPQTGGDRR